VKMKTLRRLRTIAPRRAATDRAASDPGELEPSPEAVFDRSTGPFGSRRVTALPGGYDEET
jgi:hypothetical protein